MTKTKVLVTGATGQVGYLIFSRLRSQPDRYEVFGLDREAGPSVRVPGSWDLDLSEGRFTVANLSDFNAVADAVKGMDVVAHLGADPEGREDVTAEGYIDLGQLKGNRGSQNYDIPADFVIGDELSVVIYCVPFHVVFSTATLDPV